MVRFAQAVAFFAILGAIAAVTAPLTADSQLLAVVLGGSLVAATLAYVLPWVFGLRTRPVTSAPGAEEAERRDSPSEGPDP